MPLSLLPGVHSWLGAVLLLLSLLAGVLTLPRWGLAERWRAGLAGVTQGLLAVQVALGFVLLVQGARPAGSVLLTAVHIGGPLLALALGLVGLALGRRLGPRRYVLATHSVLLAALLSFAIGVLG